MNPYAKYLDGQNVRDAIAATPGRLSALIQNLSRAQLHRSPAPGKWSISAILSHLADAEIAFAFRLRQTLAEPGHVIQPFDQEAWGTRYEQLDGHAALNAFIAVRHWNIALLENA